LREHCVQIPQGFEESGTLRGLAKQQDTGVVAGTIRMRDQLMNDS
jgi:hypothetical protein